MKSLTFLVSCGSLLLLAAGCSDDSLPPPDGGADARVVDAARDTTIADAPVTDAPITDAPVTDAPVTDAPITDAPVTDTNVTDAATPDGPSTDAGAVTNTFGFTMRVPVEHTIPCEVTDPCPAPCDAEIVRSDMDWICTFDHGGQSGHVYVKTTPMTCVSFGLSQGAEYEGRGSFISISGNVTATADATYDWGGNHHNDSMGFTYNGKYYHYYHSSFGYGWRKCQPMDCIQVYDSKGGTLLEDGCTAARTLPAVCHQVEPGESYGDGDFVDTFSKCPGDPN